MITPTFKVEQDNDTVTIVINTPYVRAQDVDLHVEGTEFRFYLRPYFLRLHFPGNILEDDDSKASYDPSVGQFTIRVTKETKGEHFPDLDLLTKLLARTGESNVKASEPKKPMIEVVGGSETIGETEIQDAIDFNWELPQEVPIATELSITAHYGFNNQYHGYFTHVQETMNEINEIVDPEKSTAESRRAERIESENNHFDEDHYCMDFINDEEIKELMKYKTVFSKELKRVQKNAKNVETKAAKPLIQEVDASGDIDMDGLSIEDANETLLKFSSKEEATMKDLPNKEYLLSFEKATYLGLVDLMFAYCYNYRVTEGDNNVESVWCIGRISPTISSLEQFSLLKDVMVSCYRRALTYPLYRNLALCEKVLQDVYIMFRLGKRAILKALLDMKYLFDHHDVYYVYSKIFLDDYCVWIQHANENVLRTLAHELHHFKVDKNELNFDIVELEEIAEQMRGMQDEMEQENDQDMQRAEMIL
ncbi:SHQ1 protein-domain-containing protein [Mucor mucedo]|uniref:SHQ1 protein-domain-containing protein n=1 Tax=Mucor mucedo TaxID=29922 RepID=UPI00222010EA|nr:SHQ1 protein-domain-containing protein [Mucor mucedo]KAI7876155.1 SHQ1 protein-domain-containing protein [Mucor mucedo]